MGRCTFLFVGFIFVRLSNATVLSIADLGAVPNDPSHKTCTSNTVVMNNTLASLQSGDTLLIPSSGGLVNTDIYWFLGGIYASGLRDVVLQFNGAIKFTNSRRVWPKDSNHNVKECIFMEDLTNVTFTSDANSGTVDHGLIDGNGGEWWGAVNYLLHSENRPRLLHIHNTHILLIENLYFKDSPYWTVDLDDVSDVEVRFVNITARRTNLNRHDPYDLTAFNTDGIDVNGARIYIHDCYIWNQDDCIAVKEQDRNSLQSVCSEDMIFERITASGLGLTVGSIGPSAAHRCVQNITFRDCYMPHTYKGIYLKSRPGIGTAVISDVLYENIVMDRPEQVPIWIGPQQASYAGSCSLLWPEDPLAKCPVPAQVSWNNIVLVNITVNDPVQSPGVVLGNATNPMLNVVFDNVLVNKPGWIPWGSNFYACKGVDGFAFGTTSPVPPCFS